MITVILRNSGSCPFSANMLAAKQWEFWFCEPWGGISVGVNSISGNSRKCSGRVPSVAFGPSRFESDRSRSTVVQEFRAVWWLDTWRIAARGHDRRVNLATLCKTRWVPLTLELPPRRGVALFQTFLSRRIRSFCASIMRGVVETHVPHG